MQTRKIRVLGLEANYSVTSDAAEMDGIGGPGTCHSQAVDNTLYRGPYGDFREGLCEWIEDTKGVARATTTKTLKDGSTKEVITEQPDPFIKRVIAAGKVTEAELVTVLQGLCDDPEYAFAEYVRVPERKAKAKVTRVPKEIASQVAALVAAGKGDALAAKLTQKLGRPVEATEAALGLAVAEDIRNQLAEQKARAMSSLSL